MKLHKQAPAKAFIVAAVAGLLLGLFGLIRSEPRLEAEPAGPQATPIDYERFFAPNPPASGADAAATPAPTPRPHTRTRGS